ncbi:MAG: hypothetical protein AAF433_14845 [Bacteroidota bacterium]
MKYFSFCLLVLLLSTSCSLDERIERREDRLIGSWQLDRATEQNFGAIFWDDITGEFRGDRINFFADESLSYEQANGSLLDGNWRIRAINTDEGNEFVIDAEFYDENFELVFSWVAEIERLDRSRLKIVIQEDGRYIRLRWDSI